VTGCTLKEITLVPAPEWQSIECWHAIQAGSGRAFGFMAKYGIRGVMGDSLAEGGVVERHTIGFQQAYKRRGIELELGERLALGINSTSPRPASRRCRDGSALRKEPADVR
jgi:hypothetical protein